MLGALERAAWTAMALAVILVVVWRYLIPRPRRHWRLLLLLAVCLAAVGYAVYDYEYMYLNFAMHDAQTVRDDCTRFLELRKTTTTQNDSPYLYLSASELPASLARVGAIGAVVGPRTVDIVLSAGLNGRAWGFVYASKRADLENGNPHRRCRATVHRNFYEFRQPNDE